MEKDQRTESWVSPRFPCEHCDVNCEGALATTGDLRTNQGAAWLLRSDIALESVYSRDPGFHSQVDANDAILSSQVQSAWST